MSEGYGKRSRAAFAAQAQNKTQEPIAPLDAADAKIVLDAHRKVEDTGPQAVPPLAPASL